MRVHRISTVKLDEEMGCGTQEKGLCRSPYRQVGDEEQTDRHVSFFTLGKN